MPIKINLVSDLATYYRSILRLDKKISDEQVIVAWLGYEKQSLPIKKWHIKKSALFDTYSDSTIHATNAIEIDARNGASLSKYMSKRKKRNNFSDSLVLDWGIHHLHLGSQQYSQERNGASAFVERSDNLLFVYPHDDTLYFITVMPHKNFSNAELISIIDANWPEISPIRRDTLLTGSELTAVNIKTLRKKGINYCLSIDGGYIMNPGGGIMANGASTAAYCEAIAMLDTLKLYQNRLIENEQVVRELIESLGLSPDIEMSFSLESLDQERIAPQWIRLMEQKTKAQVRLNKYQEKFSLHVTHCEPCLPI